MIKRRPAASPRAARVAPAELARVRDVVNTALEPALEQRQRLTESLSAMLNKDVVLEVQEDPSIIGGAMVRAGDQIIDGSVRTRLQVLKQRLERETLA